jgi:hypothetical protein
VSPDLARADAQRCIHRGLAVDADALRAAGLHVAELDGAGEPLAALARALAFPAWFGGNLDALDECLAALPDALPAAGWVVVVRRAPAAGWPAVEACWRDAAARHAADGRALHLIYA